MDSINNPLISIIVPVYNMEEYLERCIKSILKQTYRNLEIILVNDGSTDNSGKICNEYACKDSRIKVIHKENGGSSSARNAAMKIFKGKYISFVDSDDFIHEEYIQYMYDILVKYDCDIVQTEFEIGNKSSFSKYTQSPYKVTIITGHDWAKGLRYHSTLWGKLYKRNIVEGILFPEGKIFEDDATYYKFAYKSEKICLSNRCLYYYFMTVNSVMRNDNINMDFIGIYDERMVFFKEKNETYLFATTCERYAIILILKYSLFIQKTANKHQLEVLWNKYLAIYMLGIHVAPIKDKILMHMFRAMPNITARLIGTVRR